MAKKRMRIPKKIAGLKIPRALRKSKLLRSLLNSPMGRTIVADALVAGAAAAAALVRERAELAGATRSGARKGAPTVALVGEAIQDAADAIMGVVAEAAQSLVPQDATRGKHPRPARGANATRH